MLLCSPTSRWIAALSLAFALVLAGGCGGAKARLADHIERGHEYFVAGNYEKARIEFRNALQIDPKNAEALYSSGQVSEKLKDPRDAVGFYQAAIDVDPNHKKARASLGRMLTFGGAADGALKLVEPALAKGEDSDLLTVRGAARLQTGDGPGALADARRAVELDANNENAIALLAAIYRRNGDNDKARGLLTDAVERAPKSTDLRQVLAQLYAELGDRGGAERVLKELIALNPRQQNYRYQLALLYLGNKQVNEAEGVLRQAVAANPEAPESKLALIDFLATQRSDAQAQSELQGFIDKEPDNYQLRLGLAALHERANQLDKAEAVYREVIERDHTGPQGLTARTRIAVLKIRANQLDEAERLTDEVLKESPRDNDALILRGNIALAQNRPEAAIADLRAALRDQPNSPAILRALARAHLANGDPALAEESLKSAVEANPKDIDTRMDLARFLTEGGESAQAVSLLEKVVLDAPDNVAVREALFRAQAAAKDLGAAARTAEDIKLLRPDQALGYYLAGMIAEAQGKAEAGIHEYEHALALQPDANEPLTAWVRAELALKRPEVAINRLHATIDKYPQNVAVRNVLAEVLISQKNSAAAVAILSDAIARAPQWWQLYRTMAIAQLAAGNRAAAIANYQLGLKAVPGSVELAVDLAALYEQDGRSDEAIRQYEQVLTRNPKSEVLANKLAMLLVTYRKDQASLDRARDLATAFAASTNPAYLDTHGWVQYKRGEFATALPLLQQVADKVPESPLLRYHLAMAQFRNGQLKQARDNLERALGVGKKFAGVEEARATLNEIKKKQSG